MIRKGNIAAHKKVKGPSRSAGQPVAFQKQGPTTKIVRSKNIEQRNKAKIILFGTQIVRAQFYPGIPDLSRKTDAQGPPFSPDQIPSVRDPVTVKLVKSIDVLTLAEQRSLKTNVEGSRTLIIDAKGSIQDKQKIFFRKPVSNPNAERDHRTLQIKIFIETELCGVAFIRDLYIVVSLKSQTAFDIQG